MVDQVETPASRAMGLLRTMPNVAMSGRSNVAYAGIAASPEQNEAASPADLIKLAETASTSQRTSDERAKIVQTVYGAMFRLNSVPPDIHGFVAADAAITCGRCLGGNLESGARNLAVSTILNVLDRPADEIPLTSNTRLVLAGNAVKGTLMGSERSPVQRAIETFSREASTAMKADPVGTTNALKAMVRAGQNSNGTADYTLGEAAKAALKFNGRPAGGFFQKLKLGVSAAQHMVTSAIAAVVSKEHTAAAAPTRQAPASAPAPRSSGMPA